MSAAYTVKRGDRRGMAIATSRIACVWKVEHAMNAPKWWFFLDIDGRPEGLTLDFGSQEDADAERAELIVAWSGAAVADVPKGAAWDLAAHLRAMALQAEARPVLSSDGFAAGARAAADLFELWLDGAPEPER